MSAPTVRDLLDDIRNMRLPVEEAANLGLDLARRVEKVLDYCDEGYHECIAGHLKEIRLLLNGEEL